MRAEHDRDNALMQDTDHPGDDDAAVVTAQAEVESSGAGAGVPGPKRTIPTWSTAWPWIQDAVAVLVLLWPLLWFSDNDGGFQLEAMADYVWVLLPSAVVLSGELRRLPRAVVAVIFLVPLGAALSILVAWDRSEFVKDAQVFSAMPVVALAGARLWRRPRGPLLLLALVTTCWLVWWWHAMLLWWGFTDIGSQPRWELVSWRNQSGVLSGAFGMAFLGVALHARQWWALAGGALAVSAFAGVWLSSSRGSVLFLAVAVILSIVGSWRSSEHRSIQDMALASGKVAGVLLVTAILVGGLQSMIPEGRTTPLDSRTQDVATNSSARTHHWEAAAGMFAERPLVGLGLGSYRQMAVTHNPPEGNLTASAHNEWLEAYAEGGLLLGLPMTMAGILALVGLGRLAGWARRTRDDDFGLTRSALFGLGSGALLIAAHTTIDFDLRYPSVAMFMALGFGIMAASSTETASSRETASSTVLRSPLPRLATLTIAPTLALGLMATGGAAREIEGFTQLPDGAPVTQLVGYRAPWDTESQLVVIRNLLAASEPESALEVAEDLERWNPHNPASSVYLGYAQLALGQIDANELVGRLQPPPTRLNLYTTTAQQLLLQGNLEEAEQVARRTISLFPEYTAWGITGTVGSGWTTLIEVLSAQGRCTEVPETLTKALEQGFDPLDLWGDELRSTAAAVCP